MSPENRSRLISFRISDQQYEKIRKVCFSQGISSISELARAGIDLLLQQPERVLGETLESRVHEIESRLFYLSAEVERLKVLL